MTKNDFHRKWFVTVFYSWHYDHIPATSVNFCADFCSRHKYKLQTAECTLRYLLRLILYVWHLTAQKCSCFEDISHLNTLPLLSSIVHRGTIADGRISLQITYLATRCSWQFSFRSFVCLFQCLAVKNNSRRCLFAAIRWSARRQTYLWSWSTFLGENSSITSLSMAE